MARRLARVTLIALLLLVAVAAVAGGALVLQARGLPPGRPDYVALGSSYAAGPGLGARPDGSPVLCSRSVNGYPPLLARRLRLSLVDMSCGGATARHLLAGGQFFQGSQVRAVTPATRLVTITAGGNDVGLIGDLSTMALRRQPTLLGWLARRLWGGPMSQRDFAGLRRTLVSLVRTIHARAPQARIVIASYPAILPPTGTCPSLQLTPAEVALMRPVEARLADSTRAAARTAGATFVDMRAIGAAHHACSREPWVHGWSALGDAPFHPTLAGTRATAAAIARALSPAGIAAVGQDDAAGHQARRVGGEEQHH